MHDQVCRPTQMWARDFPEGVHSGWSGAKGRPDIPWRTFRCHYGPVWKHLLTDFMQCPICATEFDEKDPVILNGSDEDIEQLRQRLPARRPIKTKGKVKDSNSTTYQAYHLEVMTRNE